MARLENEIFLAGKELGESREYRPAVDTPVYKNQGTVKDWINAFSTGLWRYYDDPTSIQGVHFLKAGERLEDGYYAYAYRVIDNRIAYNYTGTNPNTNNTVSHSYLASGGEVYAAGMFRVQDKKITEANSASGHYLPDPKSYIDKDCNEHQTSNLSLIVFREKLKSMGFVVDGMELNPFRHPALIKAMIECHRNRTPI